MRPLMLIAIVLCASLAPVEAGPFGRLGRRQVTRSGAQQPCTGPNCQRPGTGGGYLSINAKGGFEGELPPAYFQQAAQAQMATQVANRPAPPQYTSQYTPHAVPERSVVASTPPTPAVTPIEQSPTIDQAANAFAEALAEKLGIEIQVEPPAGSLSELVDKLPIFRATIVSSSGEILEEAEIDFAEHTRQEMEKK
jgi:hypothetical protein